MIYTQSRHSRTAVAAAAGDYLHRKVHQASRTDQFASVAAADADLA